MCSAYFQQKMVGKSELARFSFNLSSDTNRWCFLVPTTNVRYNGTQCQDTKPAKSLLKSADAKKFDNKQLKSADARKFDNKHSPKFSVYLQSTTEAVPVQWCQLLCTVWLSVQQRRVLDWGKSGLETKQVCYLKMEGEPSASG